MKKIFSLLISIVLFGSLNATNYYVNVLKVDDSGDGLSWNTAKKTIDAAQTLALSGDNIFVKSGDYEFSSSTAGTYAFTTKSDVNYYGGFDGTESDPSQRATSDLDGNGIVESWELTHPTTIFFDLTNNAGGLKFISNTSFKVFDGFSISANQTLGTITTTATSVVVLLQSFTIFQNNTVSDINVTGTYNSTTVGSDGLILKLGGPATVNSCLFQNNNVSISAGATQGDQLISPFIKLQAPSTAGRNLFANSIIRMNTVNLDFSSATITNNYNTRGILVSMDLTTNSVTANNAFKNNLIFNNEASYTPGSSMVSPNRNLGSAGLVYVYNTNTPQADSILNNTIANNYMTRIGNALYIGCRSTTSPTVPYHQVLNNVLYKNKNTNDDGITNDKNLALQAIPDNTMPYLLIANNICSGGGVDNTTGVGANIVNNLNDLSMSNQDATGAWFTSPSVTYGLSSLTSSELTSVITSRWTIGVNSYLKGKGHSLPIGQRDKAGNLFASIPSVGAYEYTTSSGLSNKVVDNNFVIVEGNVLKFKEKGQIEVYNTAGQLIIFQKNNTGTLTLNNAGIYIVKQNTVNGLGIQKVIIWN